MRYTVAIVFACLPLFAGCAKKTNIATTKSQPSASAVPVRQDIRDSLGAARLELIEVRMNPTPGGVMKAEVEFSNNTSSIQRITYKFEWFDAAGSRIESMQSQTLPLAVNPGEIKVIRSVAPSESATDFRLQVLRR
ncbi:MAG: YcfL family protein [Phycisphaerales bacterium]